MARARNLKPGFFVNSALGTLSPLHRLLFAGLWCIADRDGRLHDRPLQIRASVLPYDRCNVSRMLQDLHDREFIMRYEINGVKCIQIINFRKHQNPHIREPKSTIPAPCSAPCPAPDLAGTQHQSGPADSLLPITSTVLIPLLESDGPNLEAQLAEEKEIEPDDYEPTDPHNTPRSNGPWWRTEAATLAKCQDLGTTPRPGENWHSLRDRLFALIAEQRREDTG